MVSVPLDSMTASRDPREGSGRHSTPFTADDVEPCAPGGIRTHTARILRPLPLPFGIRGRKGVPDGIRTRTAGMGGRNADR